MDSKPTVDQLETLKTRKPARRMNEIPSEVLSALSSGTIESKNLVEWLSVDRVALARNWLDSVELPVDQHTNVVFNEVVNLSALKKSFAIGKQLLGLVKLGDEYYQSMISHPSDVVREWSAVIVGHAPDIAFKRRLAWMKTQANDSNPAVREIAWMSMRHHVISELEHAIDCLIPWTGSRSERLRRFASEVTRPCGVWTAHVTALKQNPEIALPLLEPLRSDDSKFVRDSVANWLNDASKYQPQWVCDVTDRWLAESHTTNTRTIVKRALRTLRTRRP